MASRKRAQQAKSKDTSYLAFLLRLVYFLFLFLSQIGKATRRLGHLIQRKSLLYLSFATLSLLFFLFYFFIVRDLPSPYDLAKRSWEATTRIYDRNGVLLYKIYKDKDRTPVPLEKIPIVVRLATLAAEDAEFYNHPGFSIRGIVRALIKNFKEGRLSGGSTITQQLVKNTLLTPEKTLTRKVKEIILAIRVEGTFSKDQILEMYLNEVSYGGVAFGIAEASQIYFGKAPAELTLPEAALVAGLPKSPTKYSPFGSNPEAAFLRSREVLNLMVINKYITPEEAEAAASTQITFAPNKIEIKAPHFVMYIKEKLVEKYGEEIVEKGGLSVMTTLDLKIQELAEEVVSKEVAKLSSLNVGNGAALVLAAKTGEILAMVGSRDYFDTAHDGNVNVTTRLRQPGSSIKIVNYAYALSHGYTPLTLIDDSPVTFSVPGQPPYSPKNYEGSFRGKITLRSALAESRNIPAVKVLASYGVSKMIEQAYAFGITSWKDPAMYGLSLTLGGGEVTLLELARAYSVIAAEGRLLPEISILEIKDAKGKVLDSPRFAGEAGNQALDKRIAFLLTDILSDNVSRAPTFGTNSYLNVSGHPEVVVKTGTSNDLKDNLTVGFNQDYLVAVWVGNNDATPMARIASGVTGAAPIWNKIIGGLLAGAEPKSWAAPPGVISLSACPQTGSLSCPECPGRKEWFLEENTPSTKCILIPYEEAQKRARDEKPEGKILEPAYSFPPVKPPEVPKRSR